MGVSGRKPVPGGEVARARAGLEPGDVVAMDAPEDLTPEAAELWEIAVTDLIALKMFRLSDAPMLSEFCSSLAMAREFRREIDSLQPKLRQAMAEENFEAADAISGMLKRARSGYVQMFKLAQSVSGDFGMSPVARLRLGIMATQGSRLSDMLDED